MLFIVVERDRWGRGIYAVRANSVAHARQIARVSDSDRNEVIPLPQDGEAAVLWEEDDSPDTPRGGD